MRKKIILLLLLILFPISCKAYACSYNDKAALRKYASAVTTSYNYVEENDDVKFSVTLTNLRDDLYIIDTTTGSTYYYNGSPEITLDGYEPGSKLKFEVYTTRSECFETYLAIKYVNLPFYNKYYKDPLCEGKTNSLCMKWQKVTLSYDEFTKALKEKEEEQQEEIIKNEETIFDKIFAFIFDYYLFIIGGGLLITFTTRYFINKKNDFDL